MLTMRHKNSALFDDQPSRKHDFELLRLSTVKNSRLHTREARFRDTHCFIATKNVVLRETDPCYQQVIMHFRSQTVDRIDEDDRGDQYNR
jgi:hypothetical protein